MPTPPSDPYPIAERHHDVSERLASACAQADREPSEITLVAVSKRQPLERVRALFDLGVRDFGENQVQAWRRRMDALPDPALRWHLIGPVQTNKAKYIARTPPHLLHTIDRPSLVTALSARLSAERPLACLIQVNIDREAQKAGCLPEELDALVDLVAAAPALSLRGVMCIPRPAAPDAMRRAFARTRELGESIADRIAGPRVELSMGMSADFDVAIAEGATIVRVGTALFGFRETGPASPSAK